MFWLLIILYAVPILALIFDSFYYPVPKPIQALNRLFGIYEYIIRIPRNLFVGIFLLVWLIWALFENSQILIPFFFLFLTWFSIQRELKLSLKLAEFLRRTPTLHPQHFFNYSYLLRGPLPFELPFPENMATVSPQSISFKKGRRPAQSYWPLVKMLWDTPFLAHICLKSLKYVGHEFARDTFDAMAVMWGKRALQHLHGSLTVTGGEEIKNLSGKIILVINHKSQLDFILTFFALSYIHRLSGRSLKPRFITAKDHFVDNFFIYHVLGVGKLIEAVDMVAIDRKRSETGFQNLKKAADFLVKKEIEIAIFPQGTRAEGNVDRNGKRRDAGYYTTVAPKDIQSDLAHLRKGTAYLAVDTLMSLHETTKEDLHLVFVGLGGTATMMAKQSFQLQYETDINYRIGPILTFSSRVAESLKKPKAEATLPEEKKYLEMVKELQQKIDENLSASVGIKEDLYHRYLLDLTGQFRLSEDRLKAVENGLTKSSVLTYQILDRIYALDPIQWNPYLSELSQILVEENNGEKLKNLREQVTVRMLEGLKTKVHGKKIRKKIS